MLVTSTGLNYIYPFAYEFSQTITVTNNSGSIIPGPIYLVLLGEPNHQASPYQNGLLGSQIMTTCFSASGDYLLPVSGSLAPAQRVQLPLVFFTQSLAAPIRYTTKVLSGLPSR
jgi:hypothetical protein